METEKTPSTDPIRAAVLARYEEIATTFEPAAAASCCSPGPAAEASACCAEDGRETGYFDNIYDTDLSTLPASVTGLSLGCGDPLALAQLETGQTVLDLGSGGGIDCFLAAAAVGPTGQVIGVDMTPAMLAKAEANKAQVGAKNVEFRHGLIEALPVADETIDVIVSNCVVNLSSDKPAVFREAYRVLKPGGRLAISDMVRLGEWTPAEREDLIAWSGCIAGAEKVDFYVDELRRIGFQEISIRDRDRPDDDLTDAGQPASTQVRVFSARITAIK